MEFIKKYKLQVILFALLSILIGIIIFIFFMFVYHNDRQSRYGNRLDGIESVRIDNTFFDEFKEDILEEEKALSSINTSISGRIINVVVLFDEETTITEALEFEDLIIEFLGEDDDVLAFYDIQLFLNSENEDSENFPAIGYKNHSNDNFIWTNNVHLIGDEE